MYCAYITTINDIRKHSNADKLQCCTVFGNNVIVDLTYQKGQRIIYFPTDGQLSEAFALNNNLVRLKDVDGNDIGGYLDPSKRNVKAIKLRGEQSDGLVLPIEVLSKYGDISVLKDGDQIDVFNGVEICKKYIPISKIVSNHHTNKKRNRKSDKQQMRIVFPFFDEHTDTKQLAYNKSAFCNLIVDKPDAPIFTSALLHDVGKPFCKTFMNTHNEIDSNAHYYGHENVGAYDSLFYDTGLMLHECIPQFILNDFLLERANIIQYHMMPYAWEKDNNIKLEGKCKNLWGEKLFEEIMVVHKADMEAH